MGFDDPIEVDQRSRTRVELAAGGLVWRGFGTTRQVAVVHRTKHRDWTLPKGRLQRGESLREAAVREVREETGYEVEVQGLTGVTVHHAKGLPKFVFYWNMRVVETEGPPEDSPSSRARAGDGEQGEVDRIEWMTSPEAAERLSHLEERQLITDPEGSRRREGAVVRRRRWRPKNIRLERLRRELAILELQLPRRRMLALNDPDREKYFEELERLTRDARRAADSRRTEDGWAFLQAARQIEVLLYWPEEMTSEANLLLEEANNKLTGWRAAGVQKLLGEGGSSAATVMRAMMIRDAHFANTYYRIDLERQQLKLLVGAAWIALLGLADLLTDFGFDVRGAPSLSLPTTVEGPRLEDALLLAILLAGTLGASLSAVLDLARSPAGRIPEKLGSWTITLGRVGIGAAAALVVCLFLVTGTGGIEVTSAGALIFFSIVAGASERLLKRALAAGE